MKRTGITLVVSLVLVSIIVPAAFLLKPTRVSAQSFSAASCLTGVVAGVASAWSNLTIAVPSEDVWSTIANYTSAGSTWGDCLYNYVVIPWARAYMRSLLQQVTQDTINWINGTGNSNGQRSFVPNLSINLQAVGDSVATAFLGQVAAGFQSPFDVTIAAALHNQYLQQTSVAGFFSQYKSTLTQFSPNVNSFLGGDWSQGGVSAWLALTTQPQNNPYLLYQAAANQLATQEGAALTNRRQDLLQSGGFLSFCPPDTNSGGSTANPQAQCTNKDGTPAMATTPGSVIMSYLQTNVNSGIGQLVNAQDIDGAIGQIVQAMVSKLAGQVLNPKGLFSSDSTNRPGVPTTPTGPTGPNPGNGSASSTAQMALDNVNSYRSAWTTIYNAATTAQTNLTTLLNSCTAELAAGTIGTVPVTAGGEQTAYQSANPIIQQAQTAFTTASTTAAFAQHVLAEANNPSADPSQLAQDVITLSMMSPTAVDVATAQQNAKATGAATANPTGSISVLGGTMYDQMNLLGTNALALASQCAGYTGSTGTGTGTGTGTTPINGGTLPNLYGSATTGQLIRYATPNANQPVCFNTALTQQDVGTTRMFFLTTDSSMYTGGNVTYWISNSFNGQPVVGSCNTLGQNLSACTETTPFTFTKTMYLNVSSAGTYYWCMTLDTAGNKVGAELWPGNPPSGGA